MSDKTLRQILASVIALLLVFQLGTLISNLFGMAWGVVAAVVVAGVFFFSARQAKADGKSGAWFLLPILLFIILPLAITIWRTLTEDIGWLDRAVGLVPFMVGFAVPVVLLLVVFYELRKRTLDG